jgi:glucose/arabinose dehydrogenase
MNRRTFFSIFGAAAIAAMIGAYFIVIRSNVAHLPAGADEGPSPVLPAPTRTLIPTVNIAPARAWPAGTKPIAASGLMVTAYASGLVHPRWLYVLPNGDVLVAETDAPSRPQEFKGIRGMVSRVVQGWAGAGVPSANRITLLRDNGGGVVSKYVFLTGLNSPFGMSLVGNDLPDYPDVSS